MLFELLMVTEPLFDWVHRHRNAQLALTAIILSLLWVAMIIFVLPIEAVMGRQWKLRQQWKQRGRWTIHGRMWKAWRDVVAGRGIFDESSTLDSVVLTPAKAEAETKTTG